MQKDPNWCTPRYGIYTICVRISATRHDAVPRGKYDLRAFERVYYCICTLCITNNLIDPLRGEINLPIVVNSRLPICISTQ